MLNKLQIDIHYTFKQVKLLYMALTHSSYVNEQAEELEHNERLEFLGDAVLELAVSDLLYNNNLNAREGELSFKRAYLVNQTTLANLARKLNLDKLLNLGKGEEAQGGRERDAILSDVFEAVIGAVFLDSNYAEVKKLIILLFENIYIKNINGQSLKDNKSLLQEFSQKMFQTRPAYSIEKSIGPEHAKIFEVKISMPDGQNFVATGSSVKKAEQNAAGLGLDFFKAK